MKALISPCKRGDAERKSNSSKEFVCGWVGQVIRGYY
jgi:hypothetical protein